MIIKVWRRTAEQKSLSLRKVDIENAKGISQNEKI